LWYQARLVVGQRRTTTCLPASSSVLLAVLHGAALGGVITAAVLIRARLRGRDVAEPLAITAAWSLLGAGAGARC
jgi:hypothetical protein